MSGDLTSRMVAEYHRVFEEVQARGCHPGAVAVVEALARVVREHVAGEIEAYRERVVPGAPSDDDYAGALTVAAQVARGPSGSLGEQWERVHPVHEASSGPGG